MAVGPRLVRVLALTAITLALAGAAAPASPATALTPPTAFTTIPVEDPTPSGWATTTDPVSGISVMLPGQPTVVKTTTTDADGKTLPLRQYRLELNQGSRAVFFQVIDAPFRKVDLDKGLRGISTELKGTVTSSRHFVLDGHPALDGRYTATVEGTPAVGLVRLVVDSGYLVGIMTLGTVAEERAMTQFHQQVLGTLRLI